MRFRVSSLPGGEPVFQLDGEELESWIGVRLLRTHKGWTQLAMGKALGVSGEIVRKWESGRYPVPPMAMKLMGYVLADKITHPPHTKLQESAEALGLQ